RVRQRDVDRVDLVASEAIFVLLVRVRIAAVLARQLLALVLVIREQRHQMRILRVGERGKYCRLRDVAEADDRVPNLPAAAPPAVRAPARHGAPPHRSSARGGSAAMRAASRATASWTARSRRGRK